MAKEISDEDGCDTMLANSLMNSDTLRIDEVFRSFVGIIKRDQLDFETLKDVAIKRVDEIRRLETECVNYRRLYDNAQKKLNRILNEEAHSNIKALEVLDKMREEEEAERNKDVVEEHG